jgi:putative ABC transport system substrate-binding protein
MRRREFIALVGGTIALPIGARAQQQASRTYRIGYLSQGSPAVAPGLLEAFRQGLRELGWIEGQNIVIEYRFAEGQVDRLPGLAGELVELKVDLIAAAATPSTQAARDATKTIPIVGISFDNPLLHGLVASLARPGGNITGLSYSVGPEIFGKDLGLLR